MESRESTSGPASEAHETRIEVRYGEVDRMGFVHHRHYLAYFEQARTAFLRSLGASYRDVEDAGTLLVVVETGIRFLRPAGTEDRLVVRTRLTEARGVRLRFEYEVLREEERLATGFTVLASCDRAGRPKRPPEELRALLGHGARKAAAPGGVEVPADRGAR
jgi:acyl-CoA thioester hydrolase